MLDNELIDTYDDEESAVLVMGELNRLVDECDFIAIEKVNLMLEV